MILIFALLIIYLVFCAYLTTVELREKFKTQSPLPPSEVIEALFVSWLLGVGLIVLAVCLAISYFKDYLVKFYRFAREYIKLNKNLKISAKISAILTVLYTVTALPFASNIPYLLTWEAIGFVFSTITTTILFNYLDKRKNNGRA